MADELIRMEQLSSSCAFVASGRDMDTPEGANWAQVMHHLGVLSGKLDSLQTSVSEKRQDLTGAFSRIQALEQRPYVDPGVVQALVWRTAGAAGALALVVTLIPIGIYMAGRSPHATLGYPGPSPRHGP
jgi:hypothetical protein